MISVSVIYSYLYVLVANTLVLLMIAYTKFASARLLNSFLFLAALSLFLSGALRKGGPDLSGYRDFYYNAPERIPDILFSQIFYLLNSLSVPFEIVLLTMMALTLLSIRNITKIYKVSFLFTFCIYFAYLIPIRDLAQFRFGFAISILLIAFSINKRRIVAWPLYVIAVLCHYTAIVLLVNIAGSYFVASLRKKYLRLFFLTIAVLVIFFVGLIIQKLAFIDPRIDLYLNAKGNDGYAVQSISVVLYYILITFSFIFVVRDEIHKKDKRALVYMMICSIAIFFAFFNTSIFAFRLAHVAASLHPIMVAMLFKTVKSGAVGNSRRSFGILALTIIMLIYIYKISFGPIIYAINF